MKPTNPPRPAAARHIPEPPIARGDAIAVLTRELCQDPGVIPNPKQWLMLIKHLKTDKILVSRTRKTSDFVQLIQKANDIPKNVILSAAGVSKASRPRAKRRRLHQLACRGQT